MDDRFTALRSQFTRRSLFGRSAALALGAALAPTMLTTTAGAAPARLLSFGYDEPAGGVDAYIADTLNSKLRELSGGTLGLNQYGNAQLGAEDVMDRKVQSGDLDLALSATANLAAFAPEAGIFSLHYIFRNDAHLQKSVADSAINSTFKQLVATKGNGILSLGLFTNGFRHMFSKAPIMSVADIKGKKVRVQASRTEDKFFGAYGAVPVHMPLTQAYTSLQTGVVSIAENPPQGYLEFKFVEVARVLSLTGHEVDAFHLGMSKKTWDSLTSAQQKWVTDAFAYVQPLGNQKAAQLSRAAIGQIRSKGAKVVTQVNKASFENIAKPIQDQIAQSLGETAVGLLKRIRSVA